MTTATDKTTQSRRRFLSETARAVCGTALLGLAMSLYSKKASTLPVTSIRPPGAIDEEDFLSSCVRCGQCVRDCPYNILKLADLYESTATGTPFFIARTGPCEMCEDIPCVAACPTSALDKNLIDIDHARMGLAVLIDQETCLNFQGLRCDVCHRVCPLINQAITIEPQHNTRSQKHSLFIPVVHSNNCTGCGKCEQACVLEDAAIKILPAHLAKGAIGQHYLLGWKEKAAAGKSLVSPDTPHQFNLPDGMRYDYNNQGLVEDK